MLNKEAGMGRCARLDDTPEFFKVFIPSTSSRQLSIPEAFIMDFEGVMPKKTTLFDHSKKHWHVELEQIDECLFFKNGWQGFVKDHSLEFGNFLIFRYHKNSSFEVKIFDKDGCKREEDVDKTISLGPNFKAKKACCRPTYVDKQKLSRKGLKKNEEIDCSSQVGECKSQNPEENKMSKNFHFVAPKNPYFVLTVKSYSKYFVRLPESVLCAFNIKMMPNTIIYNQNGNMWPVKVNIYENAGVYFGGGWLVFIKENNVEVGDQCVFEFMIGEESICNEVHVQILHGNARVENPSKQRLSRTKKQPRSFHDATKFRRSPRQQEARIHGQTSTTKPSPSKQSKAKNKGKMSST